MKLKVIGWTNYSDRSFEEGANTWAARQAIMDDIRAHGYDFTGWHHQELHNTAPVLNDGKIRRYSQRGWGGLMAEAHGYDKPMDYVHYSFARDGSADGKMPDCTRSIYNTICEAAAEVLEDEIYDLLFENDFTLRHPHPELDEDEIYVLTPEEAEEIGYDNIVRQVPNILYRRLVPEDLQDTYVLDASECTLEEGKLTVMQQGDLRFMEPGDTVIVGEQKFTVTEVLPRKDVSDKVLRIVSDRNHPEYAGFLDKFNAAGIKLYVRVREITQ